MGHMIYGILLAGGTGSRMGADRNKILLPVAGIPCIARSAKALSPYVSHLILAGRPEEEHALRRALQSVALSCPITFTAGGATHQDSVYHGLLLAKKLSENEDPVILIHDGARCLVDSETIQSVIDSVLEYGSGIASIPVTDTIRPANEIRSAGEPIPREGLYAMQTPQGARLHTLLAAFQQAEEDRFQGTDDAAVLYHAGFPVHLSSGSRINLKLTTKEDLIMAESILKEEDFPSLRVGQGYDVHQLAENRKLILCGVEIPHSLGLLGHSDADVALHALMDALLGAAGLGDIGRHFPDSDDRYKGISSMKLLAIVMEKLQEAGYRPSNVDVTIVAQRPKLAPYIPQMAEQLSSALNLPLNRINVKATTTERLGFEGRMEGISAQAICMIQSV